LELRATGVEAFDASTDRHIIIATTIGHED
jgi:hypothetical protein